MTNEILTIETNREIAKLTYMMTLKGNTGSIINPGQFINISIEGQFLRRPMSVSRWDDKGLTIYYRVVGAGTKRMSELGVGSKLDCLVGLGNGFDITKVVGGKILLIGGSLGVAPLIGLAEALKSKRIMPHAIIGFNEKDLVFGLQELNEYCNTVVVTTLDGSLGVKGVVTDAIETDDYSYYFACGSENMLRAVHKIPLVGQLSLEARMGCGFGVCMGCSCKTLYGYKRICVEGPVFSSTEISFDI